MKLNGYILFSIPYPLLPIPYSLLPIHYSLFKNPVHTSKTVHHNNDESTDLNQRVNHEMPILKYKFYPYIHPVFFPYCLSMRL